MNEILKRSVKDSYKVLPLGLPVLVIYLVVEYLKFHFQLLPNHKFILDFLVLLGDAVLLHAICIYLLSNELWKKRGVLNIPKSFFQSIGTLPKVLISYMGLMLFTQLSFELFGGSPLPPFFILVFFIWSPYICSFEFFARTLSEREIDEEDAIFESLDEVSYHDLPKRVITRKSWWHLGYLRSIEITSSKGMLALSVVFLLWLIRIVPELLLSLFFTAGESFFSNSIQIFLTWGLGVFVHVSIIKSIFFNLSPEQRLEFDADDKEGQRVELFTNPLGIRLSVLSILVLFSTMLWSERRFQSELFPEFSVRTLENVKFAEEEVIVELFIQDKDQSLRWFNPSRFRILEVSPDEAKKREERIKLEKEKSNSENLDSFMRILEMMNEKLIQPARYVVYDENKKTLERYKYAPRKEQISLVLAFPIKKHADIKNESLYELSYVNVFGYKEVLFTFKKKAFPEKQNEKSDKAAE